MDPQEIATAQQDYSESHTQVYAIVAEMHVHHGPKEHDCTIRILVGKVANRNFVVKFGKGFFEVYQKIGNDLVFPAWHRMMAAQ